MFNCKVFPIFYIFGQVLSIAFLGMDRNLEKLQANQKINFKFVECYDEYTKLL